MSDVSIVIPARILEHRLALAEIARDRADTPDQHGTALNNLGNALQTLGQRESGADRLEEAVGAYPAALEEFTRDRVHLDWATTQMHLGTTLRPSFTLQARRQLP